MDRDVDAGGLAAALGVGNVRACLDVPVTRPDSGIGLLSLDAPTPHRWTDHECAMVREVADFLAVALADAHAKRQLEESELKFRTFADDSRAGIAVLRGQEIVYVNPALEAMGDYSLADLAKTPFLDIIHPDFRQSVVTRLEARARGERVTPQFEMKVIAKVGGERWLDVRTSDIELSGGPALLTTILDITERKAPSTPSATAS